MKVENVMNCSFPSWYPLFKKSTVKSLILPLPDDFVQYLLADGLFLPDSEDHKPPVSAISSDDSDNEVDWSTADTDTSDLPSFTEFDKEIKHAIKELGGCAFPKLNWSSPRDATWIAMNNSLCCRTVSDVYLLLKSSDFITHDLTEPFKFCTDFDPKAVEISEQKENQRSSNCTLNNKVSYVLILRKWIEIDPCTEFRCFVRNNEIIGICQRDFTNFYEYIGDTKQDIIQDICTFFREHLKAKFMDNDYVFDIYRKKKDTVKLVDINPYGEVTDALLFDWAELNKAPTSFHSEFQRPEFRYVTCNRGVQPSPYSHYAMPRDLVDLNSGADPYKLIDLLRLKVDSERNEVSFSDEEEQVTL